MSALACPYCNRALYFSSEAGMWYCYRCRQYHPYGAPAAYPPSPYYYEPPYYQQPFQPIVLKSEPSGIAIAAFILFVLIIILLLGGLYFYWRMFYI